MTPIKTDGPMTDKEKDQVMSLAMWTWFVGKVCLRNITLPTNTKKIPPSHNNRRQPG